MWKIVVVLLLTALAILLARLAYEAPMVQTRVGQADRDRGAGPARATPHVCRDQGVGAPCSLMLRSARKARLEAWASSFEARFASTSG